MTDLERRALLGDKKAFLLSGCELKAAAPSENTGAGWWIRSPSLQRPAMEGRGWHKAAAERGAKLRPDMQRGKVYLYQLYTTCFVEFDTLEQARAFRQYANENIECWDYDPVATIDTNDPETVKHLEKFIPAYGGTPGGGERTDKTADAALRELPKVNQRELEAVKAKIQEEHETEV